MVAVASQADLYGLKQKKLERDRALANALIQGGFKDRPINQMVGNEVVPIHWTQLLGDLGSVLAGQYQNKKVDEKELALAEQQKQANQDDLAKVMMMLQGGQDPMAPVQSPIQPEQLTPTPQLPTRMEQPAPALPGPMQGPSSNSMVDSVLPAGNLLQAAAAGLPRRSPAPAVPSPAPVSRPTTGPSAILATFQDELGRTAQQLQMVVAASASNPQLAAALEPQVKMLSDKYQALQKASLELQAQLADPNFGIERITAGDQIFSASGDQVNRVADARPQFGPTFTGPGDSLLQSVEGTGEVRPVVGREAKGTSVSVSVANEKYEEEFSKAFGKNVVARLFGTPENPNEGAIGRLQDSRNTFGAMDRLTAMNNGGKVAQGVIAGGLVSASSALEGLGFDLSDDLKSKIGATQVYDSEIMRQVFVEVSKMGARSVTDQDMVNLLKTFANSNLSQRARSDILTTTLSTMRNRHNADYDFVRNLIKDKTASGTLNADQRSLLTHSITSYPRTIEQIKRDNADGIK